MTNIRRFYNEGNIYFLTHVTYNRKPLLIENFDIFDKSIQSIFLSNNSNIIAWVVLPDHFHFLIDPKKENLSTLIKRLKMKFSSHYRLRYKIKTGRLWQYRFWDHIIRDQKDMNNHIDYIHYNPVKHGYVKSPFKWEYSSVHKFKGDGYYSNDWGVVETLNFKGEYGE